MMMKFRHLFLFNRSMATHMPEMPPPMMTTAALPWFLFPMGISGHGSVPVSSKPAIVHDLSNFLQEHPIGKIAQLVDQDTNKGIEGLKADLGKKGSRASDLLAELMSRQVGR